MRPTRALHAWRALVAAVTLLAAGAAQAVDYDFPSRMPIGCSGSAGTYTCDNLKLGWADTIEFSGTKSATLTIKGDLETDANTINSGGIALRLVVGGTLKLTFKTTITADIEAGIVTDGGQALVNGSIATTSGSLALGYATVVKGSLTSGSGAITLDNEVQVGGNVTSTSGAISTRYRGVIGGAVSTSGAITIGQEVQVASTVTGGTGAVALNFRALVNGALTTSSGTITLDNEARVNACVTSTASAAIRLGWQAGASGVCCGGSCTNSCVTNNSGNAMPAACTPTWAPQYLRATGVPNGTLTTASPTATTLANHDPGRDGAAGLMVKKGGSGVNESDTTRYQAWLSTAGNLSLSGTIPLNIWTAMKDFRTDKAGNITAYLRNCNTSGSGCTTIATSSTTVSPWTSSTTWVRRTLNFTGLSTTIAADRRLQLKIIVTDSSDDDMWIAYDTTTYASVLGNVSTTSAVNHYAVTVPATNLACSPSTVTVTACADSSSPCTNKVTTIAGQTATLATSAGTLGSTTLTFNASGDATTTLAFPAAGNGASATLTLSGESTAASAARRCCVGTSCSTANTCAATFSTAGFIIAAANGGAATTIPAQTAGTGSGNFVLRAVRTNTSTAACEAALTGSQSVNWAAQCVNPSTCSSGNRMTLTGASAVAIASNPNAGITSTTPVTMTFDSAGNAPFSFSYADVGQVQLQVSRSVNSATLTGTSNAFVVRPASFGITNVRQTAAPNTANPAATSATGGVFVRAGESFSATVTALTSGGVAAPNYGRETSPEGVVLTPTLVAPGGGATGALSNATIAGGSFSAGAATVTNLAYSEVGIVTLTPAVADGNYLGAGNVSGTTSGNVGRFIPARFALSGAAVTHRSGLACSPASAFTYLGENFRLGFTLTAQNSAGATTQNYTGAFARLDPTSAAAFNLAGRDGSTVFSTGTSRLALGSATGSFSAGAAAITLTAAALRGSSADGPFSAGFGIAPTDPDGVALGTFDLSVTSPFSTNDRASLGTLPLRFGRLFLANAIGAADRTLSMPVAAQFWNGSAFADNTLDSCTTIATSAVSFGNLRRTLTTADTAATGPVTLSGGRGRLVLAAPGGGRSGTLDVALSLGSGATDGSCLQPWTPGTGDAATAGANLAFLRGAWCSTSWDKDPAARATFGQPAGTATHVYRRENY